MEEVATEDEIRDFVGDRAEFYLEHWAGLLESGRGRAGFNWAAFLLSFVWICYRKMYGIAAIVFGVIIVERVLEPFYFIGYLGMPEAPGFLNPLVVFVVGWVCGVFGNQWYFRHATKRILNVRRQESELEVRRTKLAKLGGTSWPGMILVKSWSWMLGGRKTNHSEDE